MMVYHYYFSQKVTFQHQELINKQSKTKELQDSMHNSATKYESARSNVERTIRERRMKLIKEKQIQQQQDNTDDDENHGLYDNNLENNCYGVVASRSMDQFQHHVEQRTLRQQRMNTENRVALRELLDNDEEQRLLSKWPDIIRVKTAAVQAKTEHVRRRNTKLETILLRYKVQPKQENVSDNNSVMTSGNQTSATAASFANESYENDSHPTYKLTEENVYPSLLDTDSSTVDMKEC
jgi:hypothetical protein